MKRKIELLLVIRSYRDSYCNSSSQLELPYFSANLLNYFKLLPNAMVFHLLIVFSSFLIVKGETSSYSTLTYSFFLMKSLTDTDFCSPLKLKFVKPFLLSFSYALIASCMDLILNPVMIHFLCCVLLIIRMSITFVSSASFAFNVVLARVLVFTDLSLVHLINLVIINNVA